MHIVADDPDFDPTLWVTFDERLESPWRKMPGHSIVGRSDSYSFLRRGVSTLFFCGPEHPDYHTIRDTPDKVDYDRLTRISRLGFRITARLATHRIYPICIACD